MLGGLAVFDRRADSTNTDTTATAAATLTTNTAQATTASDASTASDQTTAGTKSTSGTDTATTTGTGTNSGSTGTQTGTGTHTGKTTGTGKSSKTTATSSISIDPRDPPGGVSMLTPSTGSTTYYKIGQYVTFAWNYTSLQVTPSAINVIASCSQNQGTWTLASNMSVKETGKVVWDTNGTKTTPLLTASYTLIIYDADSSVEDMTADPGHLSSQNRLIFGMYQPQPYTPLNEFVCVTCNGAFSALEKNALAFAAGMVTITVLSFTWFAGDFGVFST